MTRILGRIATGRGVAVLTAAAIALRLAMFLGRGDYVAFDEGWYLLLARSLAVGDGYTLNGPPHVTLSPLFPVLTAAAYRVVGDLVWSGRAVAALAAGLLVLPCWSVFRRLTGRRTAFLGCVVVAVLPALAPFVVPFWIGWDLWVGAEPLLHLLLYSSIALYLISWQHNSLSHMTLAGGLFALAYLARPEAIAVFGLLGVATLARLISGMAGRLGVAAPIGGASGEPRPHEARAGVRRWALAPLTYAVAFAAVSAPYWLYLHDATGRWQLTGRSVDVVTRPTDAPGEAGSARTIERMLWDDQETDYLRNLYSLDETGLELLSPYWGVRSPPSRPDRQRPGRTAPDREDAPEAQETPPGTEGLSGRPLPDATSAPARPRPLLRRYVGALGALVPGYLWPFVLLGVVGRRRRSLGRGRGTAELLTAIPIALTSVVIAAMVASDPRTQLFVVPALALYGARGMRLSGILVDRYAGRRVSRGFATGVVATTLIAVLLGTSVRRLYMSVEAGSPHHVLGSGKRLVGDLLRSTTPSEHRVMSWHPAIAVYADRPWCVLPYAGAPEIVRYARWHDCPTLVVSAFHPSPWPVADLGYEYLLLALPPEASSATDAVTRPPSATDAVTQPPSATDAATGAPQATEGLPESASAANAAAAAPVVVDLEDRGRFAVGRLSWSGR